MSFRVDAKGKIFTDIIRKKEVVVWIQTLTGVIHGCIYVRPDQRVKDELNSEEQFIAVTDAEIYAPNGEVRYRSQFISLNKAHVVWVLPDEQPSPGPAEANVTAEARTPEGRAD